MSTEFEKLVARHELARRRIERVERHKAEIESLSQAELERILAEPTEPEEAKP